MHSVNESGMGEEELPGKCGFHVIHDHRDQAACLPERRGDPRSCVVSTSQDVQRGQSNTRRKTATVKGKGFYFPVERNSSWPAPQ